MSLQVDIPLEVQKVADATAEAIGYSINYQWGHPREIVTTLQEMTNNPNPEKYEGKFPLIALFTDITIKKNFPNGFFGQARLQIIIANITKHEYKAQERFEKNFQPILQPLRDEFIKQLSKHIAWTFPGQLQYTEIEHYFWGRQTLYGVDGNVFNDYIDCIELKDILLNVKNKNC